MSPISLREFILCAREERIGFLPLLSVCEFERSFQVLFFKVSDFFHLVSSLVFVISIWSYWNSFLERVKKWGRFTTLIGLTHDLYVISFTLALHFFIFDIYFRARLYYLLDWFSLCGCLYIFNINNIYGFIFITYSYVLVYYLLVSCNGH